MDIETVWGRIVEHAGEVFHTKQGIPYTYHIRNHDVMYRGWITPKNITS